MKTAEGICERCGREYPVWFAENEDWNVAVNHDAERGDEWHMLCPSCFARLYEVKQGKVYAWKLIREWDSANDRELLRLRYENSALRGAFSLVASPKRPDGTYNRSREACEELARRVLERLDREREKEDECLMSRRS